MERTKTDKEKVTITGMRMTIDNARREIDAAHRKALDTIRKRK